DGIADADQVFDAGGIPVGQTNASVTRRAADRFGIVGAVHSDSRFVQAHPTHADQIVGAGRQIVVIFAPNTVVKHRFVIAEPRPRRGADYFPGPDRRWQRG